MDAMRQFKARAAWRWTAAAAALVAGIGLALLLSSVHLDGGQVLSPAERLGKGQVLSPAEHIVTLTVDYGDGVEKKFTAIPWHSDMTVLDAMEFAQKHSRGIKCKISGQGKGAFLTGIDDLTNQGERGGNWIYQVNKEYADRSFAVRQLKPNDAVRWTFKASASP